MTNLRAVLWVCLALLAAEWTSWPEAARANGTFYVSTTGDDANAGTLDAPWRTIQKAASTVDAGSTVNIRGGVYNEKVDVSVAGSPSGGSITFQSYPGEQAILDGTGLDAVTSDGFPVGLFQIRNGHYVVVQGLEVRNFTGIGNDTFPAGFYVGGVGDHIEIRGNMVHNIRGSADRMHDAHGIAVYGTSARRSVNLSNVVIDGNAVYDNWLGQSESVVVNGNVQFWTISNNVIHDNDNIGIDAVGFEKTSRKAAIDQARDGYIAGNLVYKIDDNGNPTYPASDNSANGIYVDGGTRITIERNVVHDCNIGLEIASEHGGRTSSYVTARSNLIYRSTGPGISIGGYARGKGSTDHAIIVNNTLFENDSLRTGSGEFRIQFLPNNGRASQNLFANNIVHANGQGLFVTTARRLPTPAVTLDYNLFFAPDANPGWTWRTTSYSSFSVYQAAAHEDAHSGYADPEFVNDGTLDLHLQSGSVGIDTGQSLGSGVLGSFDLDGHQRVQSTNVDVGAYER